MKKVNEITIVGGYNKSKEREDFEIKLELGEVISIVGKTGSGKSRLLEDIECMAQEDTPTKRKILINGESPNDSQRFNIENKLVAELSQNMNFVIDLSVEKFISLHAEIRCPGKEKEVVKKIIQCANELAGEKFKLDTPLTELSGGQSRALMIADTAMLSSSPIVLIDEIENAGVDRKKALELLVENDKIILMSTHDPILALMADKRIVIKNGGIFKVIETSENEKKALEVLFQFDKKMSELREMLRVGDEISTNKFI